MTKTQNNYISSTRGVLTASKVKTAQLNLKAYKVIFEDTPDEVAQSLEDDKADHFAFGTMAHKILENFNQEDITIKEVVDRFLEEYDITNRYQKAELKEMILEKDKEN